MLELLHGKAKDEAWNNQMRKKLFAASESRQTGQESQSGNESESAAHKNQRDGEFSGNLPCGESREVLMRDAAFPAPFAPGLEYNSPAHGVWNIVHIGMLLPESHQIYVCGKNCNRGVVLTAAEMDASDRFSFVEIEEDDLFNGQMEELVIDGVTEILQKLPRKPSVVFLFTVCVHHFMGCDITYIYEILRKRFPSQCFVESYMDPIVQKEGLTPDQKLRAGLYAPLYDPLFRLTENETLFSSSCARKSHKSYHLPESGETRRRQKERQVNLIGNLFSMREESEVKQMLKKGGYTVKEITECDSFAEYLSMADSFLNISCVPPAQYGAKKLSRKLGMAGLYLPFTFSYEENEKELQRLAQAAPGTRLPDTALLRSKCEAELAGLKKLLAETPVEIDATAVPRFLGLARLLLSHGIRVTAVYADGFSPEEKEDYLWLQENAPALVIRPTIHPVMRLFHEKTDGKILAVGQKAAYFSRTPYFVNIVEGGGLHGFDGIIELCRQMREAYLVPKDTKDLVMRKGLGCASCIRI